MESKYLVSVFFGSIFNGFNGIQNKNKWTNQHKLTWIHLDRKCFDMLRYISIVLELFAYCNQSIFWDICNLYYSEVLYMLSNAFSIKEIKNEIKKYINSTFFFFFFQGFIHESLKLQHYHWFVTYIQAHAMLFFTKYIDTLFLTANAIISWRLWRFKWCRNIASNNCNYW